MARANSSWTRVAVAAFVTSVLIAGCGGSSAPTTTSAGATTAPANPAGTAAAATPAATPPQATPASPQGTAPAALTPAPADPALANAIAGLKGLKSYQFKTTMSGGSYGTILGDGLAGAVVNSPVMAVQFTYVDIEVIQSGGKIWQKNGSSWDLANDKYPNAATTFDSFGPPVLLDHDFKPWIGAYSLVGAETVGGMSASHYTCNPKSLGGLSAIYGVKGGATMSADVWIAKAGYPVQFEVKASGADTFDLKFVITKANDPGNVVKVPGA